MNHREIVVCFVLFFSTKKKVIRRDQTTLVGTFGDGAGNEILKCTG